MDLKTLKDRARAASRAEFVADHPGLHLAVVPPEEEEVISFRTSEVDMDHRPLRAQPTELEVLAVSKAEDNPYPDRISVGRARNCDMVLRFGSVSKLHAHFRVLGTRTLEIVDLGSQNGTTINGRRVVPNRPERVIVGDVLRFGAITARVVDAALLLELLLQPSG